MIDRSIAPQKHKINEIILPRPTHKKLSNGIPVHEFNLGSQEVIQVELVVKAGQKYAEKPLVGSATTQLIGEASKKYSPGEIVRLVDYYGAFFESSSDGDKAYFSLFTLTKHLPTVLPIFAEAILNPVFPEREVGIYLKNSKQNYLTNQEKTGYLSRKYFNHYLFEQHPYGRILEQEDFDKVKADDLAMFHQNYFTADNCELFLAGNYGEEVYGLLEEYFAPILPTTAGKKKFPKITTNSGGKHFITKEGAIQSGIRIGKVLDIQFGSKEFFQLKILNTIFGGYFGSRLMSNIREDKGYTYGISSGIATFEDADFFYITTEVGKDVTALAVEEIYKELATIRTQEVKSRELTTVQNYMLGSLLKETDGVFSISDRYKGVYFKGQDLNFYNRYIKAINEVTPQDLLQIAQKYLSEDNLLEVIAGDR